MTQRIIDSILSKCKTHNPLNNEEMKEIGVLLKTLFGDLTEEDCEDLSNKYPFNLIQAIYGVSKTIYMTDEKSTKEIIDNVDYILDNNMKPDEATIIRMRFRGRLRLDAVATSLGVSRERIRQKELKALRKLRHPSRTSAIFTPFKVSEQIKEKTEVLEQKNKELSELISKSLDRIDILSNALKTVGAQVTVAIDNPDAELAVLLARKIEDIDFSVRASNCMRRAGIETLKDLTEKTENEMLNIRNLGRKAFDEIKEKMLSFGLTFMSEERRKENPIHTRDEIKDGCYLCEYCYHGECHNAFEWDEESENCCKGFRKDSLLIPDEDVDLSFCKSCAQFRGPYKKCAAGHLCNQDIEGCKDYLTYTHNISELLSHK